MCVSLILSSSSNILAGIQVHYIGGDETIYRHLSSNLISTVQESIGIQKLSDYQPTDYRRCWLMIIIADFQLPKIFFLELI